MPQHKLLFISPLWATFKKANGRKLLAVVAFSAMGLSLACEVDMLEDQDFSGESSAGEPMAATNRSYNTIEECEDIFHPGDGWRSLCDRHGGWGNPDMRTSNGRSCKQIDCERNAEHDVSPYFWPAGCKCKDGYTGPDPDAGLDPLPPGCKDAMAGKDTFCQKNETCRGAGTRTLKGYSCKDVNKGFGPLVCSEMFSDNDWKKMRADCCFDPDDDEDQAPQDSCPSDPRKTEPGVCGCGTPDIDSDKDRVLDCRDECPSDPGKTKRGVCGCGTPDRDSDGDGTPDCKDECPSDPNKTQKGTCGCGKPEGTCGTCVDYLSYCRSFISHCNEAPFQKYCCATCKGK